jgi:hypothetical protein
LNPFRAVLSRLKQPKNGSTTRPYYKLWDREIHGKCLVFYGVFKGVIFELHNKLNNFLRTVLKVNLRLKKDSMFHVEHKKRASLEKRKFANKNQAWRTSNLNGVFESTRSELADI